MAIPEEIRKDAETALTEFCSKHSAVELASQRYSYQIAATSAVLIEERPSFMNPNDWTQRPLAKFRYSEARNSWTLYWGDPSEKWHRVSNVEAAKDIRVLLKAVVDDPLGVFWG